MTTLNVEPSFPDIRQYSASLDTASDVSRPAANQLKPTGCHPKRHNALAPLCRPRKSMSAGSFAYPNEEIRRLIEQHENRLIVNKHNNQNVTYRRAHTEKLICSDTLSTASTSTTSSLGNKLSHNVWKVDASRSDADESCTFSSTYEEINSSATKNLHRLSSHGSEDGERLKTNLFERPNDCPQIPHNDESREPVDEIVSFQNTFPHETSHKSFKTSSFREIELDSSSKKRFLKNSPVAYQTEFREDEYSQPTHNTDKRRVPFFLADDRRITESEFTHDKSATQLHIEMEFSTDISPREGDPDSRSFVELSYSYNDPEAFLPESGHSDDDKSEPTHEAPYVESQSENGDGLEKSKDRSYQSPINDDTPDYSSHFDVTPLQGSSKNINMKSDNTAPNNAVQSCKNHSILKKEGSCSRNGLLRVTIAKTASDSDDDTTLDVELKRMESVTHTYQRHDSESKRKNSKVSAVPLSGIGVDLRNSYVDDQRIPTPREALNGSCSLSSLMNDIFRVASMPEISPKKSAFNFVKNILCSPDPPCKTTKAEQWTMPSPTSEDEKNDMNRLSMESYDSSCNMRRKPHNSFSSRVFSSHNIICSPESSCKVSDPVQWSVPSVMSEEGLEHIDTFSVNSHDSPKKNKRKLRRRNSNKMLSAGRRYTPIAPIRSRSRSDSFSINVDDENSELCSRSAPSSEGMDDDSETCSSSTPRSSSSEDENDKHIRLSTSNGPERYYDSFSRDESVSSTSRLSMRMCDLDDRSESLSRLSTHATFDDHRTAPRPAKYHEEHGPDGYSRHPKHYLDNDRNCNPSMDKSDSGPTSVGAFYGDDKYSNRTRY